MPTILDPLARFVALKKKRLEEYELIKAAAAYDKLLRIADGDKFASLKESDSSIILKMLNDPSYKEKVIAVHGRLY